MMKKSSLFNRMHRESRQWFGKVECNNLRLTVVVSAKKSAKMQVFSAIMRLVL